MNWVARWAIVATVLLTGAEAWADVKSADVKLAEELRARRAADVTQCLGAAVKPMPYETEELRAAKAKLRAARGEEAAARRDLNEARWDARRAMRQWREWSVMEEKETRAGAKPLTEKEEAALDARVAKARAQARVREAVALMRRALLAKVATMRHQVEVTAEAVEVAVATTAAMVDAEVAKCEEFLEGQADR